MRTLVIGHKGRTGKVIRDALRDFQVVVDEENDVREALKRLGPEGGPSPDIIFLDLQMPMIDGFELLRQVRTAKPSTPVVAITAGNTPADLIAKSLEGKKGNLVHLTKPFSPNDLRWAVERVLGTLVNQVERQPWGPDSGAAHVVHDLHDPESGRLDAKRIADYLAVPLSTLAAAVEIKSTTAHKTPAAKSAQERLAPIAWIIGALFLLFRERRAVLAWLNSPHPDLGARTPMSFILEGKATGISDMLEATLAGQPS